MTTSSGFKPPVRYGTFVGVFLPTILSVFGVVMFLRLGWMVGQIGIVTTVTIIVLSFTVAALTALSISAVVTNMRVGGGGVYFIISRSLGIEAGTAIGILLYLAQSLGLAFYMAGFAESVIAIFPTLGSPILVAVPTLLVLGIVALKSSDLMVRIQILIALAIAVGLGAFFVGNGSIVPAPETVAIPISDDRFWSVLAVFFPAVTGIISGIGLSGQLKNPSRSLPIGLLFGVVVAAVIFLAIPIVLSLRVHPEVLRTDTMIMTKVAVWQPAVISALWAAALSSAIASSLAAPRTLQALAEDRVLPRWLGRGFGKNDKEPRVAMLLTIMIAIIGILLGDLNAIAPVLSMVYLTAFVTLNFSAGIQSLIKAPSWRPSFRVPTSLSLTGALIAFFTMIMIDAGSGLIALSITGLIYYAMLRRNMRSLWGDARQGIMMLIARYSIQRLQDIQVDPHSWKPHFLVMAGSPQKSLPLINFTDQLSQGSGFLTIATIVPDKTTTDRVQDLEQAICSFLEEKHIISLVRVLPAVSWHDGCTALLSHYGLGNVVPDTLVIGIPKDDASISSVSSVLNAAAVLKRNVLLLRLTPSAEEKKESDILVWWGGKRNNASLMMALAYLLQVADGSRNLNLRIKSLVAHENQRKDIEQSLEEFVARARIEASCDVIDLAPEVSAIDAIADQSAKAGMAFLGLRPPEADEAEAEYLVHLTHLIKSTADLPNLALVMTGDEVKLAQLFR